MRIQWLVLVTMVLAVSISAPGASKKKSDSDSSASSQPSKPEWHKVTSSKGDAKSRPKYIKFQPTTETFRITIVAKPNTDGVASQLRVALMEETVRDQDDVPKNWKHVQTLAEGAPRNVDPTEFTGGLNQNGKPKWFAVTVSGQKAHYEITIEDLGTGKASKDSEE
jgi:hypothetical protein